MPTAVRVSAPSCPRELHAAGLVSNWEAQSHAGEQPFGVKPLPGPGGRGFSTPKSGHRWAGGWHLWVQLRFVCSPPFETWTGGCVCVPPCPLPTLLLALCLSWWNKLFLPTPALRCRLVPGQHLPSLPSPSPREERWLR